MATFPAVRTITDGTAVSSSVTNQPIYDLIERTNWLRDQLNSLSAYAKRLVVTGRPCADTCLDSNLVYLEPTTQKWTPAVAQLLPSGSPVTYAPAASCYVRGIVKNLTGIPGSRLGDIYTVGAVENIVAANLLVSGAPSVGTMLSLTADTSSAGKATTTPGTLQLLVGSFSDATTFMFMPDLRSLGDVHQHRVVELAWGSFTLISPNHWLYDGTLLPNFPINPLSGSCLFINGACYDYNHYFYFDADGLHYTDSANPPAAVAWRAVLFYELLGIDTQGQVTSLVPQTPNVTLTDCDLGTVASTGNLQLAVVPIVDIVATAVAGSTVVKSLAIDDTTGNLQLYYGPVVESITPGAGIAVSANQGRVVVSAVNSSAATKDITDIILVNAKERILSNSIISYIEFPKGIESAIYVKTELVELLPNTLSFQLRYLGSRVDTNVVRLIGKYKVTNLDASLVGNFKTFVTELPITGSFYYQSGLLLTIPGSELFTNCLIGIEIRRDVTDSYPGNFGILRIRQQ